MKRKEIARLTNIWSKVYPQDNRYISRIVIESTSPLKYRLSKNGRTVILTVSDAVANMHCETMGIYDGLINEITVLPEKNNLITVQVALNGNAECRITCVNGLPARTFLCFDRSCLNNIFSGRRIIIDPGHGGHEEGSHGPVDLLEKNVVLTMARQLKTQLEQVKGEALLTREEDYYIPLPQRIKLAKEKKAHAFISFHVNYSIDAQVNGLIINYNSAHPGGRRLAQLTSDELVKKIKRSVLEVKEDKELLGLGLIPGLKIKPVTISNWVEEGLLRNPALYDKIAVGVLNSLRRYFTKEDIN